MATRMFRVDLTQEARDFQHTATEPGLGMLDKAGANFEILKNWLGDVVAEPEFWGPDSVNFYMWESERGRLENVTTQPVTKADLEKLFKEEITALDAKIRKIRPQSTTEQNLHRIITNSFKKLIDDPEKNDAHCFLFKCRAGRDPWRLVWCWGYQRTDLQPAPVLVCGDPECNQLFLKRPESKGVCPGCQSEVKRKRRRMMGTGISGVAVLLLIALTALFMIYGQPKIVVSPEAFVGPPGSRVNFSVKYQRYFFFNDDVTSFSVALSNDTKVIAFEGRGTTARAKNLGQTTVSIRYKDKITDVACQVGPPQPPKALVIEPSEIALGVYSTERIRVMGHYDDSDPIELTEICKVVVDNSEVAYFGGKFVEGVKEGVTSIKAHYWLNETREITSDLVTVKVAQVDFKSLELGLDPPELAIGQSGDMTIDALNDAGDRYSILGSSMLVARVDPESLASIAEDEFIQGKSPGDAKLVVSFLELNSELAFSVTSESLVPEGTFVVSPDAVPDLRIGESRRLDILSAAGQDEIVTVSADPSIVEVFGQNELVGRSVGSTKVTLTQGGKEVVVDVTVLETKFAQIAIDPSVLACTTGEVTPFRVVGKTDDGVVIDLNPADLTWIQQPSANNTNVNRDELEIFGLAVTDKPQELIVGYGGMEALALVEVGKGVTGVVDGDFMSYGPVPVGTVGTGVPGLVWENGGLVVGDGLATNSVFSGLPEGAVITEIGGRELAGLGTNEIQSLLAGDLGGANIKYRLGDDLRTVSLGTGSAGIATTARFPVRIVDAQAVNSEASTFNAQLVVAVHFAGDYRVIDTVGQSLSETMTAGPRSQFKVTTSKITRVPDEEYTVIIVRKIGDTERQFQETFSLKDAIAIPSP